MDSKPFSSKAGISVKIKTTVLLIAFLMMLAACATTSPPPPVVERSTTAIEEGVPGGMVVNTMEVTAKVTAIDTKNRKVTLLNAEGDEITVKIPPEAVNFDQVRVGDLVKVTLTEQLVVHLDEEGASAPDGYAAGVALAPKGAQPGGVVAEAVQVTGTVIFIDQTYRKVTLRFEDGSVETFPVRDDIDLSKHKEGEKVMFLVTEAIAISVEKPSSETPDQPSSGKTNPWHFGVSIYGWFPDVRGKTAFSPGGSDSEFEINVEDVLENLEMVLMGSFDARKGSFGVFTDVIYMDVGGSGNASVDGIVGPGAVPINVTADVSVDMQSWIWNLAGYYRAIDTQGAAFDVLAGTRYLDVEQKVKWDITGNVEDVPVAERSGDDKASVANWDVIFGVRGRFAIGSKKALFVPYYLDVGFGESDFTWQGVAGLGYAFGWGEIVAAWRYLYYDMSSSAIDEISFSGPEAGVTFRW